MRQANGSDLLGANDARNANIGIIYVAPSDDRPSVLEAILMQDKLGRKQVAVVLPENSRAFQRPVDFDGLKNMRRGLKTEIVFVTSGVSGPAEFARQRRFTVYTSWDSYKSAVHAESSNNGHAKKGPLLFNRNKPKLIPNAPPPAPLESFEEPSPQPQPLPQPQQPLPIMPVSAPSPVAAVPLDDDDIVTRHETAPLVPSLASSETEVVDTNMGVPDEEVKPSSSPAPVAGPFVAPAVPMPEDEDAKPVRPRSKTGPIPIPITLPQSGAATKPLNPGARGSNGLASPAAKRRNTGKQAAVGAGLVGASAAAAFAATGSAPVAGGGQPPIRGNTGGGGGGGGGGSRRRTTRRLLAILLVLLTLLLLAGIAFASPIGKGLMGNITSSTVTATVTITPANQKVSDSFVVNAVTGKPDPTAHQVQARFVSYTSPSGTGTAGATGSIAGANATGTLTFINTGFGGVTINGGTLTGKSGVSVSFNGPLFIPVGSVSVRGVAVDAGVRGNIPQFDIAGNCCGSSSILVRNTTAFSGGRDPIPNSVITQSDITSATNKLISTLTPGAQTALKQQVHSGEQVVSNTLKCVGNNPTANHTVGDQAKSVTVTGTVTCTEEVYDQKGALDIAVNALKAEAAKKPGAGYALVGTVVTNITSVTIVNPKHTVSLEIAAQGEWVYQFTDAILTGIKNTIAKESQSAAQADLLKTPGVQSATIRISSGTTMPDAAHITINVLPIPGLSGSPTPGSGSPTTTPSTPTSSPAITPTTGLGGQPPTPTVLGGS